MNSLPVYETEDGVAVSSVTSKEMREVDRVAIEETGPSLLQMMENAGRALASCAMEKLGTGWKQAHILVLAGTGGNGGGGICAARHLANRGADVALCLVDKQRLQPVPAWQYTIYRSTPGRESAAEGLEKQHPDLIIDALLGYSLRSAPKDHYRTVIDWANAEGAPILALDVPSGLDATLGTPFGALIRPDSTLTLALPKTGLHPSRVGSLWLADLGIPAETFRRAGIDYIPPFGPEDRIRLRRIPRT